MYEKLIKCAAKTGFEIINYTYILCTHETKTEYCQKIK